MDGPKKHMIHPLNVMLVEAWSSLMFKILKEHQKTTKVPFHLSLCGYRAFKYDQLERHLYKFLLQQKIKGIQKPAADNQEFSWRHRSHWTLATAKIMRRCQEMRVATCGPNACRRKPHLWPLHCMWYQLRQHHPKMCQQQNPLDCPHQLSHQTLPVNHHSWTLSWAISEGKSTLSS